MGLIKLPWTTLFRWFTILKWKYLEYTFMQQIIAWSFFIHIDEGLQNDPLMHHLCIVMQSARKKLTKACGSKRALVCTVHKLGEQLHNVPTLMYIQFVQISITWHGKIVPWLVFKCCTEKKPSVITDLGLRTTMSLDVMLGRDTWLED